MSQDNMGNHGVEKREVKSGLPSPEAVTTCSLAIPSSPRERDTQAGSAFETLCPKGPQHHQDLSDSPNILSLPLPVSWSRNSAAHEERPQEPTLESEEGTSFGLGMGRSLSLPKQLSPKLRQPH